MCEYQKTFRQHRLLLTMPIVLAGLVSGWFTFGVTPSYRSSSTLWVDNSPAAGTSLGIDAGLQVSSPAGSNSPSMPSPLARPAFVEQTLLTELLYTASFDLAVGDSSSLPRFFASAGEHLGFGPSALLSSGTSRPAPEKVAVSVGTEVTSQLVGPQVLRLRYTGPSPAVAQSVLRSLITHLQAATIAYGHDFAKTGAMIDEARLRTATAAATTAEDAADAYRHRHPSATVQNDNDYAGLVAAANSTAAQLATAGSTAAESAANAQTGAMNALLEVITPPTLPMHPVLGFGHALIGVLGGLVAGLVVSLLALIALCSGRLGPWDAELFDVHANDVRLRAAVAPPAQRDPARLEQQSRPVPTMPRPVR